MSRSTHLLLLASYPIVILLSIAWSATTVEKTLYDRYIIYNEGYILPTSDYDATLAFYSELLDFPIAHPPSRFQEIATSSLELAKPQLLYLSTHNASDTTPIPVIRVRNGFHKLHAELQKRLGAEKSLIEIRSAFAQMPPHSVSTVFRGPLGDQFVTRDPMGTKILFYQKRLSLF